MKIRTGHSYNCAYGRTDDVIARLADLGSKAAPITDRDNTFGWQEWDKATRAAGLRPVFGVELGVTPQLQAKRRPVDHWTFVAKGQVEPINRLIHRATDQFRIHPYLSTEQALRATEEVAVILGRRALWDDELPANCYYELSPATTALTLRKARHYGWQPIASSDNRYPTKNDRILWYAAIGSRNAEMQSYPQHILGAEEWADAAYRVGASAKEIELARENCRKVVDESTATLEKVGLPKRAWPLTLRQLCVAGASGLGVDLQDPVYRDRLERELDLIEATGFADYFQIVGDIVRWARGKMIVGPARGSSCGSLVCYLIGITTVDPIPFGLMFERFVDINRPDMPDIDVDFSDKSRHLLWAYIGKTYGDDCYARLGAIATFRPKTSLRKIGEQLGIPPWKVDAVLDSVVVRASADARANLCLEDTLTERDAGRELLREFPEAIIAGKLEGHPHHYTQHAAGVVVGDRPILSVVAVDARTNVAMCDKANADDYGLVKIDALGLTQLSIFEDALALAGLPKDFLQQIPLDDPRAYDTINSRKLSGVFQFTGTTAQALLRGITIDRFDDIVACTALARPGPTSSGASGEWSKRRMGKSQVTYPHPIFEPFLRETLGIVVYQEQVMQIGRHVGGLSWGQVSSLRKAMSKSLGKEFFDQFGDPWKRGAIANGVDPEKVDRIWTDLCSFGSWAFNKSHSVAYGLITYWCAWLKAYHPVEYAAAMLTHTRDEDAWLPMIRELAEEGVPFVPFDQELSQECWSVGTIEGRKTLIAPLSNLKKLGSMRVKQTIAARTMREPLPRTITKLLAHPLYKIDDLRPIAAAVRRVMPDPTERNIWTQPTEIKDIQLGSERRAHLIIGTPIAISPKDSNETARVARRNGVVHSGPTQYLILRVQDDTDHILVYISRFDYERIGRPIVERGKAGRSLYAVAGEVQKNSPNALRMLTARNVRYLGSIDDNGPGGMQ